MREIYLQIRKLLAPQIRAAYEQRARDYLQQIKNNAAIAFKNL